MLITLFTPTYNRAHLLPRLYDSICKQTYTNFEWVIVNDGSTDKTDEIVLSFIADNRININYIKQENGGKHRAVNRGVKEAKGELFFIADSDDMLPSNALDCVIKMYEAIKNDYSFAGVVGIDSTINGDRISSGFNSDVLDCTEVEARCKYHIKGDMKEVFRTDVLREFPFPEIDGEKFCPEELQLVRVSTKYKFRYYNNVIYIADYQSEGLSSRIIKIRMDSPISAMMNYSENNLFNVPLIQKIKNAINYWRFYYCININLHKKDLPKISFIWYWTKPLGWIMHLNDLRKTS